MLAAMPCDEPPCFGVRRTGRPAIVWLPATRRRSRCAGHRTSVAFPSVTCVRCGSQPARVAHLGNWLGALRNPVFGRYPDAVDDERQNVEITRAVAIRFNESLGEAVVRGSLIRSDDTVRVRPA
jgi:hypothetical protein